MRVLVPVLLLVATHGAAYWAGTRRNVNLTIVKLRQHAKFLRKARWANLTRRHGLVNIYAEAARDVLELPEETS